MLSNILNNIGLSSKEIAVYIAAIRLGSSPISMIAKRADLPRSTTYNVLRKMEKDGIAKYLKKGNTMYYTVLKPKELIDYLHYRKEKLNDGINLIETYLPQLEKLINPNLKIPKITFFEGLQEVKKIYIDILKETKIGQETKAFINLNTIDPNLRDWLFDKFTKQKIKREIKSKVILSTPSSRKYIKLNKNHLRETRCIDFKDFPFKVEIDLYGENRIAIISFAENELFGLIIESENIFITLNSIFEFMWMVESRD